MAKADPRPDIAAINLFRQEALTTDGRVLPITNMMDADGQETTDMAAVVSLVAGEGSEWHAFRRDSFDRVNNQ